MRIARLLLALLFLLAACGAAAYVDGPGLRVSLDEMPPREREALEVAIGDWDFYLDGCPRVATTGAGRAVRVVATEREWCHADDAGSRVFAWVDTIGGSTIHVCPDLGRVYPESAPAVFRHELGHILGLEHDEQGASKTIMTSRVEPGQQIKPVDVARVRALWRCDAETTGAPLEVVGPRPAPVPETEAPGRVVRGRVPGYLPR